MNDEPVMTAGKSNEGSRGALGESVTVFCNMVVNAALGETQPDARIMEEALACNAQKAMGKSVVALVDELDAVAVEHVKVAVSKHGGSKALALTQRQREVS